MFYCTNYKTQTRKGTVSECQQDLVEMSGATQERRHPESELQKYGHYLAHGVNIRPKFSLVADKPNSELQKYGHYLAYGVKKN
jgi:hypothetical protein